MTAKKPRNPFNRWVGVPPKPEPGADKRYDAQAAARRVRTSGRIR